MRPQSCNGLRLASLFLALMAFAFAAPLRAQTDWRFGYEDTWSQLGGSLGASDAELLLGKMEASVAAQSAGGDVNINGLAGGWNQMQSGAGAPINFSQSDFVVRRLQAHRFSVLWTFRINAPWATAGNADCYDHSVVTECAPDAAHETDLYNYVRAIVERYNGDGIKDMGWETPGDPSDDLTVPVRFYLLTGEIEFAGATPQPTGGYGDAATNHFWSDSIANLLRTHRIVYRAVHDADPSGYSKVVGSGGILWDLYGDFPDWPDPEGATTQARLAGANLHNAQYVQSFARLRQLLTSYGNDADGIECDYVGWHPHMPWREISQAFAFIHRYAGNKPIYIDDMWANMFLEDRADAPGETQFFGGAAALEGDFPNSLVPNYTALKNGVIFTNGPVRAWYYARHSRTLVKAAVSAFGEGAERIGISGNADYTLVRLSPVGHINLLDTAGEAFAPKPAYYTFTELVGKLRDFSAVTELNVSSDPRTRVYRFTRPRGDVYVGWSETGAAPPNLDYRIATGETVQIAIGDAHVLATHIVSAVGQTTPTTEAMNAPGGVLTLQLGYEPVLLEPDTLFADGFDL